MKMSQRTYKALLQAEKKWFKIRYRNSIDRGMADCELCKLYHNDKFNCQPCPICRTTKRTYCRSSPYAGFLMSIGEFKRNRNSLKFLKFIRKIIKEATVNKPGRNK